MADSKITALTAASVVNPADQFAIAQSGASKSTTLTILQQSLGAGYRNASTASVSAAYAADTYLAGSAVTIPAGGAKVGSTYSCGFDLVKTAAGTAGLIITFRVGTLGTTGDTSVYTFPFGAGTAAVDTGWFVVSLVFRTAGAGATVSGIAICEHHLAATGLVSTGASGNGILAQGAGGSFSSTTATILGLSVNGGASFSGTNTVVAASVIL